ncbi:hypothetical protein G7Y89_g11102 [Cudoniella acicularis]|uniref:Azaphilone pigments biosynthesis cluster protein L N-terminal domain-containing protein n=1 Tax=Cudoniella acicularis TaxID=354080 RepID=A0A8H4RF42_9HELO|nr:hypothetical protein G7Y89_g11102 [Cudoniella acicularis]
MDPISIIASTAGTVGFALRTSKVLYELVDGTLDAPKEVFAVSREAKAFASVLTSLQSLIQDGTLREEGVISLQVPLDNCLQVITSLTGKIQPHIKTSGDAKKSKWRGFTWTFKREEVRNLCSRLAQSNMTLNTAISIMNTVKLDANSAEVSDHIHVLRGEIKARDERKVVLASVSGRRGSDSLQSDAGFALRRFLENESVVDPNLDGLTNPPSDFGDTIICDESVVDDLTQLELSAPVAELEIQPPSYASPPSKSQATEEQLGLEKVPTSSIVGSISELPTNDIQSSVEKPVLDPETIQRATKALFDAVEDSDLEGIKSQLDLGTSIDAVDDVGFAVLHYATDAGELEIVKYLINRDCDINKRCEITGRPTALHLAVGKDQRPIAQALINGGADINLREEREGNTVLCECAKLGKLWGVEMLLEQGSLDVGAKNNFDSPAIEIAAQIGRVEIVRTLLKHCPHPLPKDEKGWTALNCAVNNGHLEVVKLILEQRPDEPLDSLAGINGSSTLHFATRKGNLEIVQLLLNAGADIHARERGWDGYTSLQLAASGNFLSTGQLLLERGATCKNESKDTPSSLEVAAGYGFVEMATLLLDHEVDIGKSLHRAAQGGQLEMAELLFSRGAELEAMAPMGTPLMYAAESGQLDMVKSLLNRGANIHAVLAGKPYATAIYLAAQGDRFAVVEFLIQRDADINGPPGDQSPLHAAARSSCLATVRLLIDQGADMRKRAGHGLTPLHYAAEFGSEQTIQLFLDKGVNFEIQDDYGRLPMFLAAQGNQPKNVKLFLDLGTHPNVADSDLGYTGLHIAAGDGFVEVMQTLIDGGADVDFPTPAGRVTPLMRAAENGHLTAVKLLLEKGADTNCVGIMTSGRESTALQLAERGRHLSVVRCIQRHIAA